MSTPRLCTHLPQEASGGKGERRKKKFEKKEKEKLLPRSWNLTGRTQKLMMDSCVKLTGLSQNVLLPSIPPSHPLSLAPPPPPVF